MIKGRYHSILYGVLAAELVCCVVLYYGGPHGLKTIWRMQNVTISKERAMSALKKEVMILQEQLCQWQTDRFYKEQMAREQLQMAHEGDLIYYLT